MFRTVPVGSIIAVPLLASALQEQRGHAATRLSRRGVTAWVALVTAATITAAPIAAVVAQRPYGWPEGLRTQLGAMPAKTVVLNDFAVGGWLLWAEPQLTPVIDLRSEIYSMEYIRDYRRTEDVRAGWQGFLDRTKPEYALLKTKAPLTAALQEQLNWTAVGKDAGYVLLKAP
jgi:hypothetical protein